MMKVIEYLKDKIPYLNSEVKKPWGNYKILAEGPGYKVKRIQVEPQQRLSLQMHEHRDEVWSIVEGAGIVYSSQKEYIVTPGSVVKIVATRWHRIHNVGDIPLVFIEVQLGEYLGEDDIVRQEDDYGRAEQ